MRNERFKNAKEIFRQHGGVMTRKQAVEAGMSPNTFYAMRNAGVITMVSRGWYRLADLPPTSRPDFAAVALRVPKAVICLISALSFHEITTQVPHMIYLALEKDGAEPRIDYPPIRTFRFSGESFRVGVETHSIDGIETRIYCAEKTIADCFKFRNKIGLDVALEALGMYRRSKQFNAGELLKYARICRVEKVVRPYLEAIL
jgi:predicted transcriptional regulator of viral defense system